MLLLAGLGNPGPGHANQRHNIGFMAVDEIVRRHGFGPWRARFQGLASEGLIAGHKVLALKPLTYMNKSGQSVGEALLAADERRWHVAGRVKLDQWNGRNRAQFQLEDMATAIR